MLDLSEFDTTVSRLRLHARWALKLNNWLDMNTGLHLPWQFVLWISQRWEWGTSDRPGVWHKSLKKAERAWQKRKRHELLIVNVAPE